MQRVGVLNGNNITYDHDLAGLVRGLTEWGVIEWGTISWSKVQPVQAIVAAKRSNGQKLMLYFESDEQVSIPSSGTFKVYIEVNQAKIDDGTSNAENGTGIAEIKAWPSVPAQNSLILASVNNWSITDERNLIPKIQQIAQRTGSLESTVAQATADIADFKEAGAVDHLEESWIVGEKYTLENQLFKQYTPKAEDSTIAINVGDVDKNKEIHIQRIGSGTASNQLKLKMKKIWAPTTGLIIKVMKWKQVDVSDTEAYRYGNEYIAHKAIAYTDFSNDWTEFTITLDKEFWGTKGELLDIVIYQEWGIVNSTNYYQIACDNSQYSEAFSYVSVNWDNKVREKLMPYCISDGFAQWLLAKVDNEEKAINNSPVLLVDIPEKQTVVPKGKGNPIVEYTCSHDTELLIQYTQIGNWSGYSWERLIVVYVNWNISCNLNQATISCSCSVKKWDIVAIGGYNNASWDKTMTVRNLKIYDKNPLLLKTGFPLPPRLISNIGENAVWTSFWLHIDNSWLGEQIETTPSMTAKTWTIQLGNAVAFFKIKWKDWKTYKLPVFGD